MSSSNSSAPPINGNDSDLLTLMRPVPLGGDRFGFTNGRRNSGGEIFGGQYLAQALSAALATGDGRAPQSLQGLFLAPARAEGVLEAQVQRLRDGRSFAHRRVTLVQTDHAVFCADVTLHDPRTRSAPSSDSGTAGRSS